MRLAPLVTYSFLVATTSCASLAGIGADAPPETAENPDDPGATKKPTVSDQDGSTPATNGADTSLPPSTTSCAADLSSNPNDCGYCEHRCLGNNRCAGGICEATVVATATSLDSVALTGTSVVVGDRTNGKVRACKRGETDACQVVVAGAVGGAVFPIAGRVMYFDSQSTHVVACLETGCANDPSMHDFGSIDATGGAPSFAAVGQFAFWTTPSAVVVMDVTGRFPKEVDNRLAGSTRIAARFEDDATTTVVGITSSSVWAVRIIDPLDPLDDGDKRTISNVSANDVAIDDQFIWVASSDGLLRGSHDGPTQMLRNGAYTSVSAHRGVAFAVKNGDVVRIQEGAPDIVLAKNATRVLTDAMDEFVYFTTGNQVRRVPR